MKHTVAALVEDRPGVLNRVASLFRRRGFNIDSLAVGTTEEAGISRMTIVVEGAEGIATQVERQLDKLIDVVAVEDLTKQETVERELALIKVHAPADKRHELVALGEVFHARVADLGADAMIFEVVGSPEELDSFEELVRPYGVKEMARTGRIGLGRTSATAPSPRKQHV